MVCDYEIYPEKRVIFMRFQGVFTFAQIKAAIERLWHDPRYSRSYNGLIDVTDVSLGISQPDFHALMNFVVGHKSLSQGRWAAVAASPLVTALGMFYQRMIADRQSFGVFSTFQVAGRFIGMEVKEGESPIPAQLGKKESQR